MAASDRRPRSLACTARHAGRVGFRFLARLALRAHVRVLIFMGFALRAPLAGSRSYGLRPDRRPARHPAHGARPAGRAREACAGARARRGAHAPTRRCGSELCELGWPGIAISEEQRRPGPGHDRAVDPVRGAGPYARAGAVPGKRDGGVRDRAGGLAPSSASAGCRASPRARRSARWRARSTARRSW